MPRPALVRADRIAAGAAMALGAVFVLAYLYVALSRITYPYELEWMEGGMLDHVRRVLAGQPIYAKPTIAFVSFLYPPLYYWAGAAASALFGPGFLPLRGLSFLSSLGALALLYEIVRRESGSRAAGVVAACVFVATYDRVGGWFDLARLDSFYMLVLLATVYALRFLPGAPGAVVAGLGLTAAFFTKQSALVIGCGLVGAAAVQGWRRAVWFGMTAWLAVVAGILSLQKMTDGWFGYYCFVVPRHHPRIPGAITAFWFSDLLPALPVATMLALAYVATRVRAPGSAGKWFFPAVAAGMIASSWSVRNMFGAEVNNLLPAFVGVSILTGLAFAAVRATSAEKPVWGLAASAAVIAQLCCLLYNPATHLPSAADRAAGDRVVARLAAIDGEIFIPHHGYLAERAGKHSCAHTLAMDNLFLDDEGPARRDLEAELVGALAERRFAAVVLESDGRYSEAVLPSYEPRERLFIDPNVFWPVTGGRLRPEALCFPR